MKEIVLLYGQLGQERLNDSPGDVVYDLMSDGEYEEFPILVHEFQRINIERGVWAHCNRLMDSLLEDLDEDYGDPEGDPSEVSPAMRKALELLGNAIIHDYNPWMCELTGSVIQFSREMAEEVAKDT